MPIYVQWKWIDRTQTYLLILHFDSDGSEPNLRNRDMAFKSSLCPRDNMKLYYPSEPPMGICKWSEAEERKLQTEIEEGISTVRKRIVTTWAPSHIEIGLMGELLSYANRVNGLKQECRLALRTKLDIACNALEYAKLLRFGKIREDDDALKKSTDAFATNFQSLEETTSGETRLLGCDYNYRERKCESVFCTVLTINYIDYLKNILKPYMA